MAEVGWLGCEDGTIWREMGGGETKEVKGEREGGGTPPQAPTTNKAKGGKATGKRKKWESNSDNDSDHPDSSSSFSSGEDSRDP